MITKREHLQHFSLLDSSTSALYRILTTKWIFFWLIERRTRMSEKPQLKFHSNDFGSRKANDFVVAIQELCFDFYLCVRPQNVLVAIDDALFSIYSSFLRLLVLFLCSISITESIDQFVFESTLQWANWESSVIHFSAQFNFVYRVDKNADRKTERKSEWNDTNAAKNLHSCSFFFFNRCFAFIFRTNRHRRRCLSVK